MKLKFYLFFVAFISLNFANANYYIQVTDIDPLTGSATYVLNETPNSLQLPISFCAYGNSQPQIATNYKISWYRNVTNSTTNGVLINEMVVSTLAQINVQDFKNHLPDTTIPGTYYYYAVLSEPSSTGCGMTDSLTSTTQKIEVFNPATHLNFDGVDDYVSINIGASNIQENNYTHELWFKTSSPNGTLFNNADSDLPNSGGFNKTIYLQNGNLNAYVFDGGAHTITSALTYNDDNWHHVAEIVTLTERTLYVDGVLVGTDTHFSTQDFGYIVLGASNLTPSVYFNGDIDEVRIWNKALSVDDIIRRQNCEIQGDESDLLAYYKCNQGYDSEDNTTITTLTDNSTNNNVGTLTSFGLTGVTSNWLLGSPVITGSTIPSIPTATTPLTYTQGDTAGELTATSGGSSVMWYTQETGSLGATTAPIPDTLIVGPTSYWVASTNDSGCESERIEIVVNVYEAATHLNLGGINDYVDCGDDSSLQITGNTITLEAYVNFNSFASASFLGNIINKNDGANTSGYMLRAGGNGVVNFVVANAGWNETFSPANSISENTWHHIAGVYNGTTAKIYVDGIQVASQSFSITVGNANKNLSLGKDLNYSDRFLDASIDDVRIWNVARTAEQINRSKNCELQGTETGLVAYYKFNQGAAEADNTGITTLIDDTTFGNNGTLTNFALTGTSSNWIAGSPVTTGSVIPTIPTVTSPIVYNEGDTASELTATSGGTGLMWYTTETGGAGDVNLPTPNTDTVGSTSYWVASSNNNGCESERVEIVVTVDETLGVNDNVMLNDIAIYPNPTRGLLIINNNIGIDMQVTIYDINGRVLISKSNNDTMTTLDMTSFSNGIYLLRIQTKSGEFSKKVIKN
ncbi:T9SS type A sorting domain-containing protein [Bizionia gelidisalsuginis]|uniref:T9SS type A sorting domain-containing protein n=1 Tax=Bizionia gelidisalsuginis TaxID=291188 RepID=A0ABY3M7F7_9FLAO|nr:LamG-like jellyroll fold domain-containing protein [Bizionia gelidisalsuginis]TYC08829.1 T9SS type A sorting domain-containing protein [Bizionia gelidisalsuginis]